MVTHARARGRFYTEKIKEGWQVVDSFPQPATDDPDGEPHVYTLLLGSRRRAEDYATYLRMLVREGYDVNLTSAP